ncbi:hypothetical protein J7T55_005528 [Diaporthe amygdali]|uniref:uncharacterized protein n=1 Tax=Phomopsis amygdali TaxID=1214568 RepID=UPI0022FEACFC|nr:uncharacterized protein J7T55_005528 [Diaporthe amygdali]KAJ0108980.1 hypothetical protein J7T55_005528 [Diaporthe amygdali]
MARFSDLPQELRDIIWQMTIRAKRPGAHFFTFQNHWEDAGIVNFSLALPIRFVSKARPQHIGLADTRSSPDGRISWAKGNPSTYMEDSGLWTACWDSRRHMLLRFRPDKFGYQSLRHHPREMPWSFWSFRGSEAAKKTENLQRNSGERQFFTIYPETDLIILQALPDSRLSWDRGDDEFAHPTENRFSCYPLFPGKTGPYSVCPPNSNNFALEFDPKWLTQGGKYMDRFESALKMTGVHSIWFIDHKLKRNLQHLSSREREDFRENRAVFYTTDRRFIEVACYDSEWGIWDEAAQSHVGCKAFDFVHELDDLRITSGRSEGRYWPVLAFRVLACELLQPKGETTTDAAAEVQYKTA